MSITLAIRKLLNKNLTSAVRNSEKKRTGYSISQLIIYGSLFFPGKEAKVLMTRSNTNHPLRGGNLLLSSHYDFKQDTHFLSQNVYGCLIFFMKAA